MVQSFVSQFPTDLIHGKVKIKTDAFEVFQLVAAIGQLHVFESGKMIYYDDFIKYRTLIGVEAELRKRLLKAETEKKEDFSITLSVEELLVIFDQVRYYKNSHRYLVRIMNKIGFAAAKFASYIFMEDDETSLKP